MGLNNLKNASGSVKNRKRIGRGNASGQGGTAGAGHKGARSRSGFKKKRGFEGGQMPLQRRLPKRGFSNPFRIEYQVVNIRDLDRVGGKDANLETMVACGLVKSPNKPVKILGEGEISGAFDVTANRFSRSAVEKIEAAGGKVIEV